MGKKHWWQGREEYISKKYSSIRGFSFLGSLNGVADIMAELDVSETHEEVEMLLVKFCHQFGVNRSGWLSLNWRKPDQSTMQCLSYNAGNVIEEYSENKIIDIDVVHHLTRKSVAPIPWGLPHHGVDRHKEERRLQAFYKDIGCERGLMVSLHSPERTLVGGFNFNESEKDFSSRLHEFAAISHFFCASLNQALQRITPNNQMTHTLPVLTKREEECIRWAALGKTAWEISCILSIAERTVFVHTDNAKKKLGAKTLPQAVATAVASNIIKI